MNKYILINDASVIVAQNNFKDFVVSAAREVAKKSPGRKYYLAVVESVFEAPVDGVHVRSIP